MSRSGYYEWLNATPSDREQANSGLRDRLQRVHAASRGTYRRRRLRAAVEREGTSVSEGRIRRRMKDLHIVGISPRSFVKTTRPDASLENSPNLIKDEQIEVQKSGEVWVSDITFIKTGEGWLYLCIVLDLATRRIVGWDMKENLRAQIVINALKMALAQPAKRVAKVFHSDCGGQYKARLFRGLLRKNNIRQSMTHAGNCYDNATAESFFGTLKSELVGRMKFKTREEARGAIFEYIEVFYNRVRLHSALGNMSPSEFEEKIA